jgi:hypothetical protein
MNFKIVLGLIGIVLLVVALSGCTSPTKEVLVGEFKATNNAMGSPLIVKLPEGTSSVRVVYDLKAPNSYGIGGNGNIGLISEALQGGQDPFMNGKVYPSEYLAGKGERLTGEFNWNNRAYAFVYQGMFTGKFTIYATIPE